jgi:hypothetical protein
MLMMKIFGLILGQSYITSTTSTISSFSSSGDAATSGKLARKVLARRDKRILTSMPTTDLTHSKELQLLSNDSWQTEGQEESEKEKDGGCEIKVKCGSSKAVDKPH